MDPRYAEYLAKQQYEDYQNALRQEDAATQQTQSSFGGADYSLSQDQNLWKGVKETPQAMLGMVRDTAGLVTSPIRTIKEAGLERSLDTVGGLAAGTAGVAALAPTMALGGAAIGGPFAPITGLIGGALGTGIGFAGGMLGYNFARDATDPTREIKSPSDYSKDFTYNMGQGAAGGAAGEVVGAGAKATYGKVSKPFTKAGVEARVAEALNRVEPNLANKIDSAYATQAGNPFLDQRSLGELIGSDTLKTTQRAVSRARPEGYGKATELNRLRNDAQLKYLDQLESSNLTAADTQGAIKSGLENQVSNVQGLVDSAKGVVDAKLGELPLPMNPTEAGSVIRQSATEGRSALKSQSSKAFKGAGEGLVDTANVLSKANEVLPQYFKEFGSQANPELMGLINSLQPEQIGVLPKTGQPILVPKNVTMQDIQALRSQALKIAQKGDARSASIAGEIADALTTAGDNAVKLGTVTPAEAASWQKGIELWKEQSRIYNSTGAPSKSVLAKKYGNYNVPESAVPGRYFKPGNKGAVEAVRNFKEAVGTSETALEPLYRYATDSFRQYAVDANGTVNAGKARNWINRHADALKELPELRSQLSSVEKAQGFLNEKFGDLKRTQAEVQKGALSQFLQADPEQAISTMLSGKDMIKKTVATVQYLAKSDKDALAGLRRGVIEHLKKKTYIPDSTVSLQEASVAGGPTFNGTVRSGIYKLEWEKMKPALEKSKLFTDSQMKGFDYLYKEKSSQLSVEKAKMPGGSDTAQNQSTIKALSSIAGKSFIRNLPLGAAKYLKILEPIIQKIPQERFQALMEEALLNPKVARDLMQKATSKNLIKTAQSIFKNEIAAAGVVLPLAEQQAGREQQFSQPTPKPPKPNYEITEKSFPSLKDLAPKKQDVSFNLNNYSPETRARVAVESAGNPYAVSPKGAQGLSQLMPATAQEIASKLGETYMPLQPGMSPAQQQYSMDQNVRFGDYYYKQQLRKYGHPTLARAAYNAGPGRVDEAIKMAGTSRDVNKILSSLPKGVQAETIPYVNKILDRLKRA